MSDMLTDSIFKKDTELVYDKTYISNVHKKTERIASACIYIADKIGDTSKTVPSQLASKIYDASTEVLDVSSKTLTQSQNSVKNTLAEFSTSLVRLASFIQMAAASERIPASHAMAVQFEIDSLMSTLDQMRTREGESKQRFAVRDRRRVPAAPLEYSVQSDAVPGHVTDQRSNTETRDRKDRIKDILREKGQVGIKDISDVITDVSEKSIQRDLNDLIDSGTVVRIGERRWSTYRLS